MKKVSGGGLPVEIWSRFMRDAHQGVPPTGLPLGDWRGLEPAPPVPSAPVLTDQTVADVPAPAAAPIQLHTDPADAPAPASPPPRRAAPVRGAPAPPVPPADIPRAGAAPPPRDKNLINRLLGAL
jgi:penicillin-binding protein 1A